MSPSRAASSSNSRPPGAPQAVSPPEAASALAPPTRPLVQVKRLPHGAGIRLPSYATWSAAGADLCAALAGQVTLAPGERTLIPTGFAMALPEGWEAQIRPRSGLAVKSGITCLNSPGTIDADYRGEVKVILINLGEEDFIIKRSDRIAQMVISPVHQAQFLEADCLDETVRGTGGFGSTGVSG